MNKQEKVNPLFNSLLFTKIDKILQDSQWNNNSPLAISNKIFDILKETKKEFPKCKDCELLQESFSHGYGLVCYEMIKRKDCPIAKWFLKYFGEPEE